MHKRYLPAILVLTFLWSGCLQPKMLVTTSEEAIAFPGAEGFGKYASGGRGGVVVVVTNLNDEGKGSFRKAVQQNGPRIIVFAVSGTIHLASKLNIKGDVTIAGQTAPGDGICLADQPVSLAGDNIIIRYLRFRMGDRFQRGGMVAGNGGDDAFSGIGRKNIIIDHCTMSWSTDEAFSVYGGDSTTLQWNLISEPLNYSYHFEEGDTDYEKHGFGGIWGGRRTSAHHNLFAHCANRTPRFDGARNIPQSLLIFVIT
jgi:pectate lyase